MHIQPNEISAPAPLRQRPRFETRPMRRRPARRPEPREAGLSTEQIRRIVIDQIG
jgi:hypothetical protein